MRGTISRPFASSSVMKARPILFFDSGVGGLPYLEAAENALPGECFAYLADREHFPYGEKEQDRLHHLVVAAMERALQRIDPKLVVVACNTASVVALKHLRSRFSLPFVGVVPAVKLAADNMQTGKIGVLSTRQTSSAGYTERLINSFASHCEVVRIGLPGMVDLVEYDFFTTTSAEKRAAIAAELEQGIPAGIDTIVLACTHFILIEEELRQVLGRGIRLVDSREGVTRQLVRVLSAEKLAAESCDGRNRLYLTGPAPPEERYRLFAARYGLASVEIL